MSGSLIINARHRLAWHQRLVSDASTAMMWGGWLWLWSPILRSSHWLAGIGARTYPTLDRLLASASSDGLQHSALALLGTSGTLLVWTQLPARKARVTKTPSVRDYARHFELPEHELQAGRDAPVCVVHHDEDGRIVRVECREPEPAEVVRRAPAGRVEVEVEVEVECLETPVLDGRTAIAA